MKNKIIILFSIVLILVGVFVLFIFFKDKIKDRIAEANTNREITKANYCQTASDCEIIPSRCPFGCYAAVNKGEADRIKNIIESYQPQYSQCAYSCIELKSVDCVDSKCQIQYK